MRKANKKDKLLDDVISYLYILKNKYPDTKIIIKTPYSTNECTINDVFIYDNNDGNIVFDSE